MMTVIATITSIAYFFGLAWMMAGEPRPGVKNTDSLRVSLAKSAGLWLATGGPFIALLGSVS